MGRLKRVRLIHEVNRLTKANAAKVWKPMISYTGQTYLEHGTDCPTHTSILLFHNLIWEQQIARTRCPFIFRKTVCPIYVYVNTSETKLNSDSFILPTIRQWNFPITPSIRNQTSNSKNTSQRSTTIPEHESTKYFIAACVLDAAHLSMTFIEKTS